MPIPLDPSETRPPISAGEFPVGPLEGLEGGLVASAEVIEGAEFVPVEDLGEGLLGVLGDAGGGLDEAGVAQVGPTEMRSCPLAGVGNPVHVETSSRPGLLLSYTSPTSW